jgi:hypothetical protein
MGRELRLRGFRRKSRREKHEPALDEPSLEERLASLPDDVATRLASMYRGEAQRGRAAFRRAM